MGAALEEESKDGTYEPDDHDGSPDDEEAAEDHLGEEVPVEEADGELDEAGSYYPEDEDGYLQFLG